MALHYSNTLRYDMNGRKRKSKKVRGEVYEKYAKPREGTHSIPTYSHRSSDVFYPSAGDATRVCTTKADESWKVEASKNFTVAPAYNKGAYQVVSKENIKHIGR